LKGKSKNEGDDPDMTAHEHFLVTGGAGFIGSHICDELVARGHQVRVLDDLSQGHRDYLPEGVEFIEGSIVDLDVCRDAVDGIDGVFHLAAMSKVAPSIEKIEFCTEQNILGTQNILIASRDAEVQKLVYSGSSTYYGNQSPPQTTDMLPECLNPYALSKYVGEQFCELFTRLYGFPTIALRYFNVYGPRQPRTGAYALVLGIFLEQLSRGEPLTIHGDGSQERDFVHVKDVVAANLRAFESNASGVVLNVGSGVTYSIKYLADAVSRDQLYAPRRRGDAEVTLANIDRTSELIGWRPEIPFDDGLAEMIESARLGEWG
jgi:UDP-glucose 4-epimerase